MIQITLDEMKRIELEIMDEIDRVCRENDIQYYIGYGSLIGAMRHGGFIPWDDDMDIFMFRADYERFFEVFREKGRSPYKLVSWRDQSSPSHFFKVVDTSTLVEETYLDKSLSGGVWVDVFPYDEIDVNDKEPFDQVNKYGALRYLAVSDPKSGSTPLVRLGQRVMHVLGGLKAAYKYADKMDQASQKLAKSGGSSDIVADVVAHTRMDIIYPKSLFEPMEVDFEGHTYFAPKGYEEYLRIAYGDWRALPPEDQREPHSCRAFRLEPGERVSA